MGRGFPALGGLLPPAWALSTCACVLNAKYAPPLKTQEMSLLLQKEDKAKAKKNRQAPGLPVDALRHSRGGAPSGKEGLCGRSCVLEILPVLYVEGPARCPWERPGA